MIEADDIRRLLADYHNSLALARELALKLLDASQPDSAVLASDIAARHRRLAGDAISRIEASENWVGSLWKTYNVDRRQGNGFHGHDDAQPDRRKHRHST